MPELDDGSLRFVILGCLRVMPQLEAFPLKVREVIDNYDDQGVIQSFTIVTASGLRFRCTCEFLEEEK
jgi:hypothetical protein